MKHYCQYHNINKLGRPTSSKNAYAAFTDKKVSDNYVGNTIWLISGEKQGDKTAYLLEYAFIVETIELRDDGRSILRGTHGYLPTRPTPVKHANWLAALKARTRNFSNGLSLIPAEFVPEIAEALGWSEMVIIETFETAN